MKAVRNLPAKRAAAGELPVVYTQAVRALQACCDLDEAKTFVNASEALDVWAKIYKKNDAGRQAKQLRLHAHRRMGELAIELAPKAGRPGGGSMPGPVALLRKHGLTRHQADAAHHLAKISIGEFDKLTAREHPPAPTSVTRRFRRDKTVTPWAILKERPRTPFAITGYVKNNDPVAVAKRLSSDDQVDEIRQDIANLYAWCAAFLRAL